MRLAPELRFPVRGVPRPPTKIDPPRARAPPGPHVEMNGLLLTCHIFVQALALQELLDTPSCADAAEVQDFLPGAFTNVTRQTTYNDVRGGSSRGGSWRVVRVRTASTTKTLYLSKQLS